MNKWLSWKGMLLGMAGAILLLIIINATALMRFYSVVTLYDKDKIVENFQNMPALFNATEIKPSSQPNALSTDIQPLPDSFEFEGQSINLDEFLASNNTTGLLVLKNGVIVSENYYLGHHQNGQHISFSVAKSFISALFGIAIAEGYIDSIEQTVTDYVPELKGSGYDGVRIKDVLQMSSGVKFNEDYGDFNSDINRFSRTVALGQSFDDFTKTLQRERQPGTYHHYVSIDTQVLGMILTRATGQPLSDYLQQKIWQPLGMEHPAYWLADDTGMELALGGLNVSLRDYARFGQLYLNQGQHQGQQIVPRQWVVDSVTPDAPHLMPGKNNPASDSESGYGYQWWIPNGGNGEFQAQGIYGQYIFVDPANDTVIVKNSANHLYNDKSYQWAAKHQAMFRQLSQHYSATF
ncbi:serine hydrolase domain-containing protein [Neptunicella sp. SCSIO 80796]|uniref:serine hydrolase domain-containing protein n=1 Tax=Neptunicella plasticusilytica TaxID=3117012 RepID=UPI003A4E3A7A